MKLTWKGFKSILFQIKKKPTKESELTFFLVAGAGFEPAVFGL